MSKIFDRVCVFGFGALVLSLAINACNPQCAQLAAKTALDVASCATSAIASAAAPLLNNVSGLLLGSASEAQVQEQLKSTAISAGAPAVLCALDRVITDLGGAPTAPVPSAPVAGEEAPTGRALRRGLSARAEFVRAHKL